MLDGNHAAKKQKFHKEVKEISSNIKQGFQEGWGKVGQWSAALLPSAKYGTVPAMFFIRLNDHENVGAEKKLHAFFTSELGGGRQLTSGKRL